MTDYAQYVGRLMRLLVGAEQYLIDGSMLKLEVREALIKKVEYTQTYCKRLCKLLREVNGMVPRGTAYAIHISDALLAEQWEDWPDE